MAVADAPRVTPAHAQPFEHLLLDFLAYLEFERGLSRNTLEAYRSDLLQLGAHFKRTGADALTATHSDLADFVSDLAAGGEGVPPAGLGRQAGAQRPLRSALLPAPAAPRPRHRQPDGPPAGAQAEPP